MRPIKFRGITFKGDFVYGDLNNDRSGGLSFNEKRWIRNNLTENSSEDNITAYWQQTTKRISWRDGAAYCNAPVKPETIGQFTGLCDKNGKEIYEGDIANISRLKNQLVIYKDCKFGTQNGSSFYCLGNWDRKFEVIGNIHENPELLK